MHYLFSHWEVDVDEKLYDDGQPMLTKTYKFDDEDKAVKYANIRYREGKRVKVRVIQFVENWVDIYGYDNTKSKPHHCVLCGDYIERDNLKVCDKCASEYEF
jgi:hypothetical protein